MYLKKLGSRIQTILNGIKRPLNIVSNETNINYDLLCKCVKGELSEEQIKDIIYKLVDFYPIRLADIYFEKNNSNNGIIFCSREESIKSSRIIKRKDKTNNLSNFYKYYDCAMSKHIPFKPELIEMLRTVDDSNPNNKDVIYNRGHLETQLTFYIGDVNFYYSINGEKFCSETNTGDSSIKLPYIPHTFTNRNSNTNSKILAITFSSNIALNLINMSNIEYKNLNKIAGDIRDINKLLVLRLNRYLELNFMTKQELIKNIYELNPKLSNLEEKINKFIYKGIYNREIAIIISKILNIDYKFLEFENLKKNNDVIFKNYDNIWIEKDNLKINKLATSKHIHNVSHFNIEIIGNSNILNSSYYQFIYNYSKTDFEFYWGKNLEFKKIIRKDDNLIIEPFVNYQFKKIKENSKIYLAKIPGILNEQILNEFSKFDTKNKYRLCNNESDRWW